jgi:hypothetical protein
VGSRWGGGGTQQSTCTPNEQNLAEIQFKWEPVNLT